MFVFKKRRNSNNKYTLIIIIMIIAILYIFKTVSPQKEAAYPDIIQYDGLRYIYTETVKAFPIMFTRKSPASEEGYMVLAKRGIGTQEEVYIYEGFRRYRRYVVLKE